MNAAPKSASTYVTRLLARATGGEVAYGGDLSVETAQDFTIAGIARSVDHPAPLIFKHHVQANALCLLAIERLQIRYVNTVRNLFDTIVSVDEHLQRTTNANGVALWSEMKVRDFKEWDDAQRYGFIVDHIMPWYIRYFWGWWRRDPGSLLYYEDLVQHPDTFHAQLAARLQVPVEQLTEDLVAKSAANRFNIGRAGRCAPLRPVHLSQMRRMASYYPGPDYGRLGL